MYKKRVTFSLLFALFAINLKVLAQQSGASASNPPSTLTSEKKEESKSSTEASDPPIKFEDLKALDYPELQVVPRASERLALEAGAVRDRGVLLLFPYITSSVLTLSSGLLVSSSLKPEISGTERTEALTAAKFAIGAGAVGLGMVYWFTYADNYGATLSQIRSFKNRDRRTELLKERLSEEAFERSANLINQWKWIFAITNLAASAQLTGKMNGDSNVVPGLSVAASLLPLIITTTYETNYTKQLDYKRRIYVPLTWFDYGYNPKVSSWQPQLNAIWTF